MLSMLSWFISFIYNPQTHSNDETKDSISVESKEILDNDGDIVEHFTKKTEDFYIINNNYIDTITNVDNTTEIHAVEAIENNSIKNSENKVGLDNQIDKITSPSDAIVPDSAISADNSISSLSSLEKRDSTSSEDVYPEKINEKKKKRKRKRNKNKQRKNRKKNNKKKNKNNSRVLV